MPPRVKKIDPRRRYIKIPCYHCGEEIWVTTSELSVLLFKKRRKRVQALKKKYGKDFFRIVGKFGYEKLVEYKKAGFDINEYREKAGLPKRTMKERLRKPRKMIICDYCGTDAVYRINVINNSDPSRGENVEVCSGRSCEKKECYAFLEKKFNELPKENFTYQKWLRKYKI